MTGLGTCAKCGAWSADPCNFCGTPRPPGTGPGYEPKDVGRCGLPARGGQRCLLQHGHSPPCVVGFGVEG